MKTHLTIALCLLLGLSASCTSQNNPRSPVISIPEQPSAMPEIPYFPPPLANPLTPTREYSYNEIAIEKTPISSPLARKSVPLGKKTAVIVLDAGHGGEDFGTHSLGTPKYQEKYLNISTTLIVKKFLEQFGHKVIMTRDDDRFISLEKRAAFANEQNPQLFVSIHYNSAPSKEAEGIEVFFYNSDSNKSRTHQSKVLARAVLDKVLKNTQAKSRGVKHGNFAVIRETTMPAILIEGGFLSNVSEMEKLKSPAYLKSIALGIAQGIQEYIVQDKLMADHTK
jgi:N-acetylmuramoyl-L-alanine amidase